MHKLARFMFVAVVALLGYSVPAAADTYYIRSGATGKNDGSNWTNAYDSFASAGLDDTSTSTPRGHTFYVADGDYGSLLFKNTETGNTIITIKKATESDHGTDTGWQSAYASGQAQFASIGFRSSYWVFDGVVGSGGHKDGYGFILQRTSADGPVYLIGIPRLGDHKHVVNHVTVSHVAMVLPGDAYDHPQVGIYSNAYLNGADSINISNCYFYNGSSNMLFRNWSNSVIEYCYFAGNWSSPSNHGQQISPGNSCNDIVLRGNTFVDSLVFVIGTHKAFNYRWRIYNNLVIGGSGSYIWANADSSTSDVVINWEVHHNTHVGTNFSAAFFAGSLTDSSFKSTAYNNLFFDCTRPNVGSNFEAMSNAYFECTELGNLGDDAQVSTGDPFVDVKDYDLRLVAPTSPGVTLYPPFDEDYSGNLRGTDGAWDRGAYLYLGNGGIPSPIRAPSGLRLLSQ